MRGYVAINNLNGVGCITPSVYVSVSRMEAILYSYCGSHGVVEYNVRFIHLCRGAVRKERSTKCNIENGQNKTV